MSTDGSAASSKTVSNVAVTSSLRIPDFNAADPEMWFAIVEAYFSKARIVDEQQRYLDVVSSLPPRFACEVRDIIMRPLDNNSYAILKCELIKRLCSSQDEKTRKLLENVVMEDEKPSQYLRRLQALAGSAVPEDLLRTLWMRGLPEKLQPTMATQKGQKLTDMAEVADSVFSLLPARHVPQEATGDASLHTQILQLTRQMSALQTQMAAMVHQVQEVSSGGGERPWRPSRPRSRSHSRPRSRSREPRPDGLCWYHWKFQQKARKCTAPCSWTPENRLGGR
jgi:hypothetical protein